MTGCKEWTKKKKMGRCGALCYIGNELQDKMFSYLRNKKVGDQS